MEATKTRKEFNSQSKGIVFNVYNYFKTIFPNENKMELKNRVVAATGVSLGTIRRIISDGVALQDTTNGDGEIKFSSPKKRKRKCTITDILPWEQRDIRNIIYNFHKTENCRVTLTQLQQKLSAEYDFSGKRTSLHSIIRKMGFKWTKSKNNRGLLIEKSDIRALRLNYLDKIKYYRSQGRPIVFLDETYIHAGHTSSKSWTDNTTNGLLSTISKGNRLVILNAGGEMGFIPNCLLIFKSGTKSGDYHDDMNSQNYEKWLSEKLIPNLPPNSVIVCDNAPYHNIQLQKPPTSNSRKADMIDWLTSKNITFSTNLHKPQLYEIIKYHKRQHIVYKFDKLLEEHGHVALRLPPYHPDLNPIEMIWAQVKNNVAKKNVSFKIDSVKTLTEEEFASVTVQDWMKCCQHVVQAEDSYLQHEIRVDVVTENLIITDSDSETSGDSDFENLSD